MSTLLNRVRYDVIWEPLAGEIVCGDQYLVKELNDSILIAVADGLGHGNEAASSAMKTMAILEAHAEEPIDRLVALCDHELQEMRGVALTVARISNTFQLSYLAIGNVTGVCWNLAGDIHLTGHSLFLEGGIVGSQLPSSMKIKTVSMNSGDIIILATDGIDGKFEIESPRFASPEVIAKHIFETYRDPRDDGLVLVVQLL